EPEVSTGIGPADRFLPAAGHIRRGSSSLRTVDAVLVGFIGVAAGHKNPFAARVFPEIVQESERTNAIVAVTAEQPEIPGAVGPSKRVCSRSRKECSRRVVARLVYCKRPGCESPRTLGSGVGTWSQCPGIVFP